MYSRDSHCWPSQTTSRALVADGGHGRDAGRGDRQEEEEDQTCGGDCCDGDYCSDDSCDGCCCCDDDCGSCCGGDVVVGGGDCCNCRCCVETGAYLASISEVDLRSCSYYYCCSTYSPLCSRLDSPELESVSVAVGGCGDGAAAVVVLDDVTEIGSSDAIAQFVDLVAIV